MKLKRASHSGEALRHAHVSIAALFIEDSQLSGGEIQRLGGLLRGSSDLHLLVEWIHRVDHGSSWRCVKSILLKEISVKRRAAFFSSFACYPSALIAKYLPLLYLL